jgi:hypothetical protein
MSVPCSRKSRYSALPLLGFFLLPFGCAGNPEPEPLKPSPQRVCPPPMVWSHGVERPRRLSMSNRTGGTVSVWLDNCSGHLRLGNVKQGKTRVLTLPDRLIPFSDQLHFHVFDTGGTGRVGSYAVNLEPLWTLSLDVDANTPEVEMVFGEGATELERFEGLNGFVVYAGEELSYASRWAEDTPAFLSWQCSAGEAKLTLTHGVTGAQELPVEVVYLGSRSKTTGQWDVYRGSAVMLSAPPEIVEEITEKALEAEGLEVTVGTGAEALHHTFRLSGFHEARRALGCFIAG